MRAEFAAERRERDAGQRAVRIAAVQAAAGRSRKYERAGRVRRAAGDGVRRRAQALIEVDVDEYGALLLALANDGQEVDRADVGAGCALEIGKATVERFGNPQAGLVQEFEQEREARVLGLDGGGQRRVFVVGKDALAGYAHVRLAERNAAQGFAHGGERDRVAPKASPGGGHERGAIAVDGGRRGPRARLAKGVEKRAQAGAIGSQVAEVVEAVGGEPSGGGRDAGVIDRCAGAFERGQFAGGGRGCDGAGLVVSREWPHGCSIGVRSGLARRKRSAGFGANQEALARPVYNKMLIML